VAALFGVGALVSVLYIVRPGSIDRPIQAHPNDSNETQLLVPYINTITGGSEPTENWGTTINIANTTKTPFAAGSPNYRAPQSGTCTFYFYPATPTVTVPTVVTPTIPSGGSYTLNVNNVTEFAGNTGYAIATCNFLNAYGFAEVYDNYGIGAPTATMGYEVYILPSPGLSPH